MKKIILILIILVGVTSCKKSVDEPRTLKGRIFHDCDVPASNLEYTLTSTPSLIGRKNFSAAFTTDSLGYFEVVFHPKSYNSIRIRPKSSGYILDQIPLPKAHQTLNVGNVYSGFTYQTVVHLNVTNPYTENDTLYYGDMSGQKWKVGPFESMILDTLQYKIHGNLTYNLGYQAYETQANFHIRSNGQIILRGSESDNGVMHVPKIADVCENGILGKEIFNIR